MGTSTDRYLMGMLENLENLSGTLSSPDNLQGLLSNATLRGIPVELRVNDAGMMQWKYLDEEMWKDLIDFHKVDYELLLNLPQIEGVELIGNKTFEDLGLMALTAEEIQAALT